MPPRTTPPAGKPRRPARPPVSGAWIWMVIGLLLVAMLLWNTSNNSVEIPYSSFALLLKNNPDNVKQLSFAANDRILGELRDAGNIPTEANKAKGLDKQEAEELAALQKKFTAKRAVKFATRRPPLKDDKFSETLDALIAKHGVKVDVPDNPYAWVGPVLLFVLPAGLLLLLFFVLMPRFRDPLGGGFLNNYVKSPARRYERTKQRDHLRRRRRHENAKSELQEVVEFLKSAGQVPAVGRPGAQGRAAGGPPGTGKTLLAKAVAGEAGVPFFSISGSEFIQMFVGVGASRVRDMFKTAKEAAPVHPVYRRDRRGRTHARHRRRRRSDEREQTLNQILSEMDGFAPTETVIVVAATNRPDVLDPPCCGRDASTVTSPLIVPPGRAGWAFQGPHAQQAAVR